MKGEGSSICAVALSDFLGLILTQKRPSQILISFIENGFIATCELFYYNTIIY